MSPLRRVAEAARRTLKHNIQKTKETPRRTQPMTDTQNIDKGRDST